MNTIQKIKKLYEQNPEAKAQFEGDKYSPNYSYSLDELLKILESNQPQDFSIKTLDAYEQNLYLSVILAHLPAKVIYNELGDDVLMWTWVQYPYTKQKDVIAEYIQKATGRNSQ